ncbi:coiled-coil domain-containing protein [Natronorubrum thiooxidans]|uniref:Uncharacterized protein n=1 Tax=Natronorubrum thiooxidans TaxID=308853 RepID=A0A1N7GCK4_9EURY|nr:hypothetical protein [Natronorubrum thiooxidans]SIS10299.1 hypothetical protein SAMN05421752_11147 [Natronorubrum thiooxidans]
MPDLFTAEEAGVTVTKHVDVDGDVVQIGLRLDSSRECPLTVRVLDAVPTNTTIQVPKTDPPCWSTDDETVEYERTLESEEAITTGYKYTVDEGDTASHHAPTLIIDGEATQAGADNATTYDEDEEFEMPGDEVSVTDMVGNSRTGISSPSSETRASADGGDATATGAAACAVDEAVVDGDEPIDGLSDLAGSRSSLELRVMYLQSQLQDLATYIDAMEEFLDDHGTGEDVLTEVLDELHAVREQLECVREEQTTLDTRLDALEDRTDQLESTFERRQETVDADLHQLEASAENRHEAVDGELQQLERTVEDVEET